MGQDRIKPVYSVGEAIQVWVRLLSRVLRRSGPFA
jgi:hypothetical protein